MDSTNELSYTLQQIGLTEKEARVYLALLSLESATAYRIAEHCEVKKPTVYVILEDLRKKGLVLKVPHVKKSLFSARNIGEYLQEQEARLDSVRSILPKLQALGIQDKLGVFFFTGLQGVTQAIDHKFDLMRGETLHSFYGDMTGTDAKIIKLLDTWDRKAIEAGISFNIVMAKLSNDEYQKNLIELSKQAGSRIKIKFMEQYAYPPNIHFEIGGDFVRILDVAKLNATIIDDKQTAEALRQIFKIVWESTSSKASP
jgi:DNA-binding MarR family transcriptional regulator